MRLPRLHIALPGLAVLGVADVVALVLGWL